MNRISLRQLAKQYAEGSLDREAYRRARAEYLDAVLNGDQTPGPLTQANYTSPRAVAGEETVTSATFRRGTEDTRILMTSRDPDEAGQQDPALQTQPIRLSDGSRNPVYIIAGIIAGVLVLSIGVSLLLTGGDDSSETSGVNPAAEQPTAAGDNTLEPLTDTSGNAALAQLKAFLESPDWSQQALDDFVSHWQTLPQQQRDTALETTLARQLGDALFQQLQEERALQGLDDDATDSPAGQKKIVDFAREIGLEDRRLEVTATPSGAVLPLIACRHSV